MKQSKKIALSAITAALSTAVMLASYFPYLTYTIPAVAGLFMMMPLIAINAKYAFGAYAVSALFTLFFAEPEAAALYICLLGYYPILKAIIERIKKAALEWIIKIAVFNLSVVATYLLSAFVLGVSFEEFGETARLLMLGFWLLLNITFVLYDIAISRVCYLYISRIHKRIKKLLDN